MKQFRQLYTPQLPLDQWLNEFLRGVDLAAKSGLAAYRRLILARQQFDRHLAGRRRSSRLPDLAALILERPLISAPLAAKELRISQQAVTLLLTQLSRQGVIRELTGRGRFRAYGIVG